MLPAPHRLTRGAELRRATRTGRRAAGRALVVHLLVSDTPATARVPRVGFVVSRAVGSSVVRHRVQRRLRHLCRERLDVLPRGSDLVVRALPDAARTTYAELGAELDRCLERVLQPGPGTVS